MFAAHMHNSTKESYKNFNSAEDAGMPFKTEFGRSRVFLNAEKC